MSAAVQSGRRPVHASGSARARAANQKICAVVRADATGELPFCCECGMDYCQSSVWLTMDEARALIESGRRITGAHFGEI